MAEKRMSNIKHLHLGVSLIALLAASACTTTPPAPEPGIASEALTPRIASNVAALDEMSPAERGQLQLIATNLVATLMQLSLIHISEPTRPY